MSVVKVVDNCVGCGACSLVCPSHCIKMSPDAAGFSYPQVEETLCIDCGLCVRCCPACNNNEKSTVLCSYAAMNTNEEQRLNSSSGGIFPLLAEKVIKSGGVVFGAAMTEDCKKLNHIEVSTPIELNRIYGSKYLQSDVGETFRRARSLLEQGRNVLYSGTPCQINGLKRFLRAEYSNLCTVDVICHGVPSPLLWTKYIEEQERRYKASFKKISFRDKRLGWKNYGMYFQNGDGLEAFSWRNNNPYMYMFLHNYCLRPSCYSCPAKECRLADITLGDFWGIKSIDGTMDDAKGTSAVIVRTSIGKQMMDEILPCLKIKQVDYSLIVKCNSAEIKSVEKPRERNEFFADMNRKPFKELQRKYVSIPIKQKLLNFLLTHHLI